MPLGTPRLDEIKEIINNKETIKNEFYRKYNIDTTKKIFFYMSHSQAPEFGVEIHKENFEALKEVIKNNNCQLVIKLHPSETDNLFNKVFEKEKDNIILLPKEENLYHSIISSSICASAYSTTLVEAMCFEIPTLQMNCADVKELPDYSNHEGCINIKNKDDLNDILEQTSFTKEIKRQNKLLNNYFNNLGDASISILLHIKEQNAN